MKKLAVLLIFALMLSLVFSACGHEHTWLEATCTEPRTCSECGKTEGEPYGHEWDDATCSAPKTCVYCGATEGSPLPHTWDDATCIKPKTCTVCGATEGSALGHISASPATYQHAEVCLSCGYEISPRLIPDFETYGLTCELQKGVMCNYYTECAQDTSLETSGVITVLSSDRVPALDGFDTPDGYEWFMIETQVYFSDDNCVKSGANIGWRFEDYYDTELYDSTVEMLDRTDFDAYKYTVSYNGKEYSDCLRLEGYAWGNWEDMTITFHHAAFLRIPIGYDGTVFGYHHMGSDTENLHFYEMPEGYARIYRLTPNA